MLDALPAATLPISGLANCRLAYSEAENPAI